MTPDIKLWQLMKKSLLAAPHGAKLLCWQSGLYLDWKIFHYWTNEPLVHTWNLFQCIKTLKYNSRNSESVFQKKKKNRCKIIDHTYDFRSNPSLRFILLNSVSACLSLQYQLFRHITLLDFLSSTLKQITMSSSN